MSSRLILCCLGNPGGRYDDTRHNVGFRVGDDLVSRARGRWSRPREEFEWSRVAVQGTNVTVVKPRTYMNLSGEALDALREVETVDPDFLLVVCDDIALPFGALRLRLKGGDGGHNGLKSVIASLGTQSFPRLRLGVGPVPDGADAAEFVLGRMSPDEVEAAGRMVREAVRCVETLVEHGTSVAMNRFNAAGSPPAED